MSYATPLEARIAKKVTKAIIDYKPDRGRRSRHGRPVRRQGQLGADADSATCCGSARRSRSRSSASPSIPATTAIATTSSRRPARSAAGSTASSTRRSARTIEDLLADNATPCSLCARLRRGVLYRLATEVGATKIALGHHLDDFIETLLLNLFFAGALKAMPARLVSDNGEHVVIRPLVGVTEAEARNYAKASALPIIGCCCPACGDLEPAASAHQAAHRGARGRASRYQELDDSRARQRRHPPSARSPAAPGAGAGAPSRPGAETTAPSRCGCSGADVPAAFPRRR